MSNVVGFKGHNERNVTKLKEALTEVNKYLNTAYLQVSEMEDEYDRIQEVYNEAFLKYANEIGHENVSVDLLKQARGIEVIKVEGSIVLQRREKNDE
jgi:hypothetical protein